MTHDTPAEVLSAARDLRRPLLAKTIAKMEDQAFAQALKKAATRPEQQALISAELALLYGPPLPDPEVGDLRARLDRLTREKEARYDCHGGPGTTLPECGQCVTCLMRERDAARQAEAEREREREDLAIELAALRADPPESPDTATLISIRATLEEAGLQGDPDAVIVALLDDLAKARAELSRLRDTPIDVPQAPPTPTRPTPPPDEREPHPADLVDRIRSVIAERVISDGTKVDPGSILHAAKWVVAEVGLFYFGNRPATSEPATGATPEAEEPSTGTEHTAPAARIALARHMAAADPLAAAMLVNSPLPGERPCGQMGMQDGEPVLCDRPAGHPPGKCSHLFRPMDPPVAVPSQSLHEAVTEPLPKEELTVVPDEVQDPGEITERFAPQRIQRPAAPPAGKRGRKGGSR